MKVNFNKIRSFIFILLLVSGLGILYPVHKSLLKSTSALFNGFSEKLYEATGLHFDYENLSPSVLSTLYVKNIVLYDDENNVVLSVNKTKINYKILKLLRQDFSEGFYSIVIDGIHLKVDDLLQISSRFSKTKKEASGFDYTKLNNMIPQNVKLKNIFLLYKNQQVDSELIIKEFEISPNSRNSGINFQLNSLVNAKLLTKNQNLSCNASISGSLLQDLQNSSVMVKISNFTNGTFVLNKLNFLVTYVNSVLGVHIVQNSNPISLGADLHLETGDVNVEIKTAHFSPVNFVNSSAYKKQFKKLSKLYIDTDTIVKFNYKEKKVNFISDLVADIPASLLKGGAKLKTSLYGNEKNLEVTDFSINGSNISVSSKLSYEYKKMQLSGFTDISNFMLKNGKSLVTELYFDPLDKGFMIFSPQLFVGDDFLTALQFSLIPQSDSLYYNFEASDYSHIETGNPGVLKLDGSFVPKSKYVEASVSLSSIFADTVVGLASQLVQNPEKLESIKKMLGSYMLSGDAYFSSDFKGVSYNVPYVLIANVNKQNQFLMLSLDGNDQSLQINQFSLIAGKFAFEASGSVDKNLGEDDMFFVLDAKYASVPYHFTGSIMKNGLLISGDYKSEISVNFENKNMLSGNIFFENLPVNYSDNSILLSTESYFSMNQQKEPEVKINRLEIENSSINYSVNPKVYLSGNLTKYGCQLENISYTDLYTSLSGNSSIVYNFTDGLLDSFGADLILENPYENENVTVNLTATNPYKSQLSLDALLNSIYLDMQVQLKNISLNRFVRVKSDRNFVTGSFYASGTVNHPYVSLNLEDFSILNNGKLIDANGNAILEDRDFFIESLNLNYNKMKISNVKANISLATMTGDAEALVETEVTKKSLSVPLKMVLNNSIVPEGKIFPDSFMLTLSSDSVSGDFMKKSFGFSFTTLYNNKNLNFFSSDNIGINGYYTNSGDLFVALNNSSFASFNLNGNTKASDGKITVSDINFDLNKMFSYISFDKFLIVNEGLLKGGLEILKNGTEPEMTGKMVITSPEVIVNIISPQKLNAPKIDITVGNGEVFVHETVFAAKNTPKLKADCTVFLNRLSFDHLESNVKSVDNEMIPGKLKAKLFQIKSDVNLDLKLNYEASVLDISGKVIGEKTVFSSEFSDVTNYDSSIPRKVYYRTDLVVALGTHATLDFEPLLRCVFVPNTTIKVYTDTQDGNYKIDGLMSLRSGDIAYLNRSFYIKRGSVNFNTGDIANPQITISAETREKDLRNQTVKIILSAENQYLQEFNPRFTSIPAKSENEIRSILGQMVLADSNSASNFIFAASDYALQTAVMRKVENSLRDLLNFDIFSVRTNVLQNALNIGVTKNNSKEVISIGNFLDNSTVYIGKYLGSSLYLDAMLHVSFEDSNVNDITSAGALIFQPEFGMELEAPFGNIRWNMAPDINALMNHQYVPSSSLTLSWKFSF